MERVNELRTVNRLLIRVRTLAYQGQTPQQTGRMLDDIQYLLNSVIEASDEEPFDRKRFIAYLRQLEDDFQAFNGIAALYQEENISAC